MNRTTIAKNKIIKKKSSLKQKSTNHPTVRVEGGERRRGQGSDT